MSQRFSVAIYMEDKAYGGPEEGGWWYTYGDLIRLVRIFPNEEKAFAFCRKLNERLDRTVNKGRRSIGSVLSEGRYTADVSEGVPPQHYPAAKPHYE